MSLPVFLTDPDTLATAAVGERLTAGPQVAGHAVRVRRLGPGDELQLIDGAGVRVTGTVGAASPDEVCVDVTEVTVERQSAPALVLVQALAKGERDLMAVEAATEVGVDAVVPWAAQRSIADWPAKKAAKARAKWHNTLTAATLQARRSRIPELHDLARGTALAQLVAPGDAWIVLHESGTTGLNTVLRSVVAAQPQRIVLVVGPEGGIADAEVALLRERGAHVAVLGDTILRASTAGPVALGIVQSALGHWT